MEGHDQWPLHLINYVRRMNISYRHSLLIKLELKILLLLSTQKRMAKTS